MSDVPRFAALSKLSGLCRVQTRSFAISKSIRTLAFVAAFAIIGFTSLIVSTNAASAAPILRHSKPRP
jgi:hypothetical protein